MGEKIIGVDIGATKTRIGIVQNSEVIKELEFPTSAQAPKDQIISELVEGIEQLTDFDFEGIGIGVPGLVDEKEGVIYDLRNIPSWKEVHLKEHLESHFKKPVSITNDANIFVLGEKTFGKGGNYKNLVGITLGSGFGTGIVIDNKLYSGAFSSAGEIGGISYLDKTIEDYCSGKFFLSRFGIKGNEVAKLVQEGDADAIAGYKEFGAHLGNALIILMNVLSPEAFFLGGSITKSYSYFSESLFETLDSYPFQRVKNQMVVHASETANISILGSAALVLSGKSNAVALGRLN